MPEKRKNIVFSACLTSVGARLVNENSGRVHLLDSWIKAVNHLGAQRTLASDQKLEELRVARISEPVAVIRKESQLTIIWHQSGDGAEGEFLRTLGSDAAERFVSFCRVGLHTEFRRNMMRQKRGLPVGFYPRAEL